LKNFKIKEFEDASEHFEDIQQTGACAVESYHKEDVSKLQQGKCISYTHASLCTIMILECWPQFKWACLPYKYIKAFIIIIDLIQKS